ncbi:hypothetical protein [Cyanophage S-TIM66]|nr:hypothetical protein [Cyanophage S-TIM66]
MKINYFVRDVLLFLIINTFVFTVVYLWQNDMIMPNQDIYIQRQNGY